MAETHVIEVRAGRGEPPSLELRPGLELAPLSVGTGGAWQVHAGGVRAVHLYLYFDGQTLFLQSAAAEDPPLIDGKPVPAAWTPAPAPCTITFGQARLAFHAAEPDQPADEDRTIASAMAEDFHHEAATGPVPVRAPGKREAPARPFKPGAFVSGAPDDESTRLQPLEDFTGPPVSGDSTRVAPLPAVEAPGMRGAVRPAAGAPWNPPPAPPQGGFQNRQFPPPPPSGPPSDPRSEVPAPPSQLGPAGPPSGLLNVPPPSARKPEAPEAFPDMLKREWAAAPPLRRGLVVALPIAVLVALWLLLAGGGEPAAQPRAATAPTASAAPSATATAPPPDLVAQVPTVWPPVDPPPPSGARTPPGPSGGAANTPGAATAAAGTNATGDASTLDHRERMAADFVSTHAYDQAIRLYDQLAAEHPQNPAFHEAARILRGKLATGTP
jgi:hypothetical protein